MSDSSTFPLKLHKTYYDKGFFNVIREFDHLVGDEGSVTLTLLDGCQIEARIDRSANQNGTARIIGGAVLRDWFQRMYSQGNIVPVRFDTMQQLSLG